MTHTNDVYIILYMCHLLVFCFYIEMKELCEARVNLEMSSYFQMMFPQIYPPHLKLPVKGVNSLLIYVVSETPFEMVNLLENTSAMANL